MPWLNPIPPLRKCTIDGANYTRTGDIEAKLLELHDLGSAELVQRCKVRSKSSPDFVPSECLLHFVRATRGDNSDAQFERLYDILLARLLRLLPSAGRPDAATMSLTDARIRERVLDRFVELLSLDRLGYEDRLDYFEIRFEGAVARLRADARSVAWREENRSVPLELDESGDASMEVERAAGSFDPFDAGEMGAEDYRTRLDTAIDSLPEGQARIVTMVRQGIPVFSENPGAVTIAKALGKSDKTIRTHRDKAYITLREFLKKEDRL